MNRIVKIILFYINFKVDLPNSNDAMVNAAST